MKANTVSRSFVMLGSIVIVMIVVGAWFDTYPDATVFGKYTVEGLVKLAILTLGGYFAILFLRFLFLPQAMAVGDRRRVIPVRTKVSTALIVSLAGFVVVESALQWKLAGRLEHRHEQRQAMLPRFDPYLQTRPRANDEALSINRWGFRGEEIDRDKPPSTYRIFVVGGSTVYSDSVDFEDSHVRQLELLLRRRYPGVKVEVQNAGMHWHTSQHSLIKILFNVQDFDPDLIIVFHGINDLVRSFSPAEFARGRYRSDYSHFLGPIAPIIREYFDEIPVHGLITVNAVVALFREHWFADFRDVSRAGVESGNVEVEVEEWPSLTAFERNMTHLANLAGSLEIDLILASQPYLYRLDMNPDERKTIWFPRDVCRIGREKPDIPSMIAGMDRFNAVSREVARTHGIRFVDLEAEVPKSLEFFRDDVHYTAAGNHLVGRLFAEAIIDRGYITRKFPQASAAAGGSRPVARESRVR